MKASLVGFQWKKCDGVSLDEIFSALGKIAHEWRKHGGFQRLVYVDKVDGFHVGLFLTSRDVQNAATVAFVEGRAKVRVRKLGDPIVDFNFFVLKDSTGRGLYQRYHHSAGIGQFTSFTKAFHDHIRDHKLNEAVTLLGARPSKRATRDARRPFRHTLKFSYIMEEGGLRRLLNELRGIDSFEFEFEELTANSFLSPLEGKAKKKVRRLVYSKTPKTHLIKPIVDAVNGLGLTSGSVVGQKRTGGTKRIDILENPCSYGEFDVDEIANDEMLDVSDIKSSPFLKQMLDIAKNTAQVTVPSR